MTATPSARSSSPGHRSGLVLLVAPARSYRVASYQQACARLGYRLMIVSDSKHSVIPAIAQGITVDFDDPDSALERVLDALDPQPVSSVIATDDRVVALASRIATALDLPHNAPDSAELTRRKDLARLRLRETGCNTPAFRVLPVQAVIDAPQGVALGFPLVIKPLMLSGSRGVMRADTPQQLSDAAATLQEILAGESGSEYELTHCLVESYLDGQEIAFDGFVQNGCLRPLAVFDKPEPLTGPCFEETVYITPSRHTEAVQRAILEEIERCCAAYGLRHGPVHAEARITDRGIVLLEMASRTIGGQCASSLEFVLGAALEDVVLKLGQGEAWRPPDTEGYSGVLMIPIEDLGILQRVEGLLEARRTPHVSDIEIHIQPGYELVPLPRGASYLGFIFAQAEDYDRLWQALRQAHARLRFVTRQRWSLEPA